MAKRFNSPDLPGVLHFVTLNVREQRQAFRRNEYALLALNELRFECDRHPAYLAAYVVMPNHLHFLILPKDGRLSRFLARYKPAVTKKLDALALQAGRQTEHDWLVAKGKRELWQDGKYSVPLTSSAWIEQKINYVHDNPVRAGLVEHPMAYPWSSFAAYHPECGREPPVPVDVNCWK